MEKKNKENEPMGGGGGCRGEEHRTKSNRKKHYGKQKTKKVG